MLPKAYDPSAAEDRIYALWENAGAFTADVESVKPPFTVAMPPPNATGELHLGHAVMLAIEDILIRTSRMQGFEALWIPGTDHASIATESVVIRKIQQEEKIRDPRASLGRSALLRRIAEFVEQSRGTIRSQMRKMGASCDWTRERYTLDPALNRCVNEVFLRMSRDGLIYRGHRIVNWDPKMQTTVSDDEIERREQTEPFYTLQYGPFVIGTSRPETKFGDKYVVMHPDDERYAAYKHGDTFTAEWINGPVVATIIKDKAVDPAFGTGVMTITPWHDAVDFDIAERHGLEKMQIIDFEGKLLEIAGEFGGMTIEEARPLILEKLKKKGLLVSEKPDYVHSVALNYRGGGIIEPQIKEQWFIDVQKKVIAWEGEHRSLKEIMQHVVRSGRIRIIPEHFTKTYFHWVDHLRDWCISRQIWWGHRVPVWCKEGECSIDVRVGTDIPKEEGWVQDPDTLDTWFSSALWTWSTLVDPKLALNPSVTFEEMLQKSPDFQKFHPTTVMETGYDILFFWVARMILMTTYATSQIPFETIYLHGLVRTRDGKKMSKSDPATVIDPLAMISSYGADALRLSMIVGQSPGNDFRLYEEKIAGYRNFVNKLWNAARFVLLECEKAKIEVSGVRFQVSGEKLSLADRALLSELQRLIEDVTEGLKEYRLSEVGERLYSFVWDYFCDWYLELSKGDANHAVLIHALRTVLTLLHPYIPFVTEELWSSFKPKGAGMLIKEPWPAADAAKKDPQAVSNLDTVIQVVTAIRKLRTEQNVEPGREVDITIVTAKHVALLESQEGRIKQMGKVKSLTLTTEIKKVQNVVSAFLSEIEVHLHLKGLIDKEKEKKSLTKEQAELGRFAKGIEAKLGNKQFLAKAPAALVSEQKEKLAETKEKLRKIAERLKGL